MIYRTRKPFDLLKALAGDPVVTRKGIPVNNLHLFKDKDIDQPLCGIIKDQIEITAWNVCGQFLQVIGGHDYDLFMVETTRKLWIAVIKRPIIGDYAFPATYAYSSRNSFENNISVIREPYFEFELELPE